MNHRQATVYSQADATTAKTEPISLDLSDVVSRLQVKFNSTNASNTATGHPAKQISKVELVDGSDVLLSLSGQQIEALMFFKYGVGRNYEIEYRNGVENRLVLDILFGRYLYDPILALDPGKFKNPQLKITHNKALGGSAPSSATLEIFADVFDEKKVSPIGFLMQKEFFSWPLVANEEKGIDLPTDYPIRKLLICGYLEDNWWDNLYSHVKLSEDNDKKVPYDIDAYDLMQLAFTKYGPYKETMVAYTPGVGSNQRYYITPVEVPTVSISTIGSPVVYTDAETVGGYFRVENTAVRAFRAAIAGYIPHGAVPLDFGDQSLIEDWYDVTKKGNVKLKVKSTSGASAASTAIVTEQIRKFV